MSVVLPGATNSKIGALGEETAATLRTECAWRRQRSACG